MKAKRIPVATTWTLPRIPPIKSQGIKTKLVPWIRSILPKGWRGTWIEPFMGTGVVGFNVAHARAIMCDTNPHLIAFYTSIQSGAITAPIVADFLLREGELLRTKGEDHFYKIRDRFNAYHSPLDFLFCNRAGFNGMIRFNKKGGFNIPFCRKPDRFAQSYRTKITNQVSRIGDIIASGDFEFRCQDFKEAITGATSRDLIYCDPPYIGRHVDYYNGWTDDCERSLHAFLGKTKAKFIVSTWHHNDFRKNAYLWELWKRYTIVTRDHFYHVGGSEANRNPMVEALVCNFPATIDRDTR